MMQIKMSNLPNYRAVEAFLLSNLDIYTYSLSVAIFIKDVLLLKC